MLLTAVAFTIIIPLMVYIKTILNLEMQNSSGVVLVSYSAFKSNPPNEFKLNKDGAEVVRLPDSSQVTIISDRQELSNTDKINLVKTTSELDAFRNQLFNRPL